MKVSARRRINEGGFTLIETLVALALMGLVLSALANLTAQWLPNWNRGLNRIQRSELIATALQRMADDLAAAQSVPVSRKDKKPLFAGSEQAITFVRTALGPNAGPGLDVVHVGETTDREGLATVRSRTLFRPLSPDVAFVDQLHFGEPVVLLRAPYQLSFAYAGDDQAWKDSWREQEKLPAKVRLTVRDASSGRVLTLSTVATIHVQSSAQVDCKPQQPNRQQQNGQQQNAQQQAGQCDDATGAPANAQGNAQSDPSTTSAQGDRS
jgi:general secretion pathway protein J